MLFVWRDGLTNEGLCVSVPHSILHQRGVRWLSSYSLVSDVGGGREHDNGVPKHRSGEFSVASIPPIGQVRNACVFPK